MSEIKKKVVKIKSAFSDERGEIKDIIVGNFNSATIVTFNTGSVRGNHFHKKTSQWNYILKGKVKYFSQFKNEEIKTTILSKGDLIKSSPNEKHAFIGLKSSEVLVITKGPRSGKNFEDDTYRLKKKITD